MARQHCQRIAVFNGDVFTFHGQHTAFLETTQQSADSFHRQAQIVTDIATGHGETELTRRETTLGEAARQVIDKCSQALFSVFLRQQQDHVLIAFDLTAHETHHLLTQIGHFTGEIVKSLKRDFAHHGGFQRLSKARVMTGADSVEAN